MLNGQAPGLGCTANDISCVCQNRNFIYGLRDCSAATCGSEDARRIVEFGISICRGMLRDFYGIAMLLLIFNVRCGC